MVFLIGLILGIILGAGIVLGTQYLQKTEKI